MVRPSAEMEQLQETLQSALLMSQARVRDAREARVLALVGTGPDAERVLHRVSRAHYRADQDVQSLCTALEKIHWELWEQDQTRPDSPDSSDSTVSTDSPDSPGLFGTALTLVVPPSLIFLFRFVFSFFFFFLVPFVPDSNNS